MDVLRVSEMFHTWIFPLIVILLFIGLSVQLWVKNGTKKTRAIPGLDKTSKEYGNSLDINKAGGLYNFIFDLHKRFGPIASFWLGKEYMVSIASPELFKQHRGVFDRPVSLFKIFEPLIGPRSIQFANGEDGRHRRTVYDRALSHASVKHYFQPIQNIADELCKKWSSIPKEEHIPLNTHMSTFTLKVGLVNLLGSAFNSDKEFTEFHESYDIVWSEMERSLTDSPEEDRPKGTAFEEGIKTLKSKIKKAIQQRRDDGFVQGQELLLDVILEHNADDEAIVINDAITYAVGGFHTVKHLLTLTLYFFAKHAEVQEKAFREMKENLGDQEVDHSNIGSLLYMRQVINETFRWAVIAPFAARYQEVDSELGGYMIPKNTPVIHSLGVVLQDKKYWPHPDRFDPDRFSPENVKTRPSLAFQPFGFAGKRICPGNTFAYAEAIVCLVSLLRKFKISLVENQDIRLDHGFLGQPADMIWVKIVKR